MIDKTEQETKTVEGTGTIIPPKALFMRRHVGGAAAADGSTHFDMDTMMDFTPVITCKETGKSFHLSWTQVLDMAIASGIDKP